MNNKELLAAEYVLGTLSHEERSRFASELAQDSELLDYVTTWEKRLSPLSEYCVEETPDAELFAKLEARIEDLKANAQAPNDPASSAAEHNTTVPEAWQKHAQRWKLNAFAGYSVAAALLLVMFLPSDISAPPTSLKEPLLAQNPQSETSAVATAADDSPFVAVFQQDDAQPAFLMTVDLNTRTLKIQPITAQGLQGKTYQLWIKEDSLGPAPQSLGLLQDVSKPTLRQLNNLDPELLKSALFGISVEPEGGSPTGKPTGPAIHGHLYPTNISL